MGQNKQNLAKPRHIIQKLMEKNADCMGNPDFVKVQSQLTSKLRELTGMRTAIRRSYQIQKAFKLQQEVNLRRNNDPFPKEARRPLMYNIIGAETGRVKL